VSVCLRQSVQGIIDIGPQANKNVIHGARTLPRGLRRRLG